MDTVRKSGRSEAPDLVTHTQYPMRVHSRLLHELCCDLWCQCFHIKQVRHDRHICLWLSTDTRCVEPASDLRSTQPAETHWNMHAGKHKTEEYRQGE
jgi:hypothetical protein